MDAAWARWVRPWTLLAWMFLTFGIGLGSWWAYYTLGWGGWWFWDPVENASFIPWLTGTALLHSAIVVEKREALKSWTILLAIVTFSLSLLGTFLVRSGVLTSVHAFASDPTRGVFILALLAIAVGGSFALYAVRAPNLDGGGVFAPISREGGLLVNNLLLTTAAATVLLGTLYPLITEVFTGERLSVGPPYFNGVFIPLMVPLVALMGLGPLLAWKRGDLVGALSRLKVAGGGVLIAAAATLLIAGISISHLAGAMGLGMAAWLAIASLLEWSERIKITRPGAWTRAVNLPRAAHGMTLAHFGVAILIAGVTVSSVWKQESIQALAPGEAVEMAGYTLTFEGVEMVPGPNYQAAQATIILSDETGEITVLKPERRNYIQPPQQTTFTAIHTTFFADVYTALGEPHGESGAYVTRFYYEPLVPFLWYGILLMVFGGVVSLTDRRYRVGAPRRAKIKTSSPAPVPAE